MKPLAAFRAAVEPDRKVVVILEDADEYVGYQEQAALLQLLDGDNAQDGILVSWPRPTTSTGSRRVCCGPDGSIRNCMSVCHRKRGGFGVSGKQVEGI